MPKHRGRQKRTRWIVLIMRRGSKHDIDRAEYLQRRTEWTPRGMDCKHSKLTDLDVIEIRSIHRQREKLLKYIAENLSNEVIMQRFDISKNTVTKIVTRQTWCHLP